MRVLEIGGGLSGFQFVIDQSGCEIVNVETGGLELIHGRLEELCAYHDC
jgi:hypothetical protein